jgi:hypothetical protein
VWGFPGLRGVLASDTLGIGAPGGIRTPDHCLRRAVLYPAELRARVCRHFGGQWRTSVGPSKPQRDYNPAHATSLPRAMAK